MDLQLHVKYTPTSHLHASARNARTHDSRQVRQIARSIEAFGFINPVLIDASGTVIAGHGRLLAAEELGLTYVPTIRIEHLSETERRAYRLADNKLAENAGWDSELLRIELSELAAVDINFDVELTGFSTPEIDFVLGAAESDTFVDPEPGRLPVATETVTRPDDLWQLGSHRLLCTYIRDRDALCRLMQGDKARMVITDPPYNVLIDGHASGLGRHHHAEFAMASGELDSAGFIELLHQSLGNLVNVSLDGALHYVFMDWRHLRELLAASEQLYSAQLNLCVWTKTNGGMGSLYRSQHELVAVFKVGQAPHLNQVELGRHGRNRTNVWHYAGMNTFSPERDATLGLHPTVKPVNLIADAILDVTRRGDIVLDGFLGSGTTILAAEQVGRIACGVEIEPRYVDVAIDRWQRLTGESARLFDTNTAFEAIAAERFGTAKEVPRGQGL